MKSFNFAVAFGRAAPWTCRSCTQSQKLRLNFPAQTLRYASTFNAAPKNQQLFGRRTAFLAGVGLTIGIASVSFGDDIRHAYQAVERSGRVVSTLAVCMNDYRVTLNANEKLEDVAEQSKQLKACHQRCAERTLKVLEKNGSIFIKLGQHLSAMNYLLPAEWCNTFIPLQDKCPVSSYESIQAMFEKDTGNKISDFFSEFAKLPIGAASLAQVHLATIKESGQKVAVKVQHPALAEWANLDLALTSFTFSMLKKFFPEYDLEWLSSEMEYSLPLELNFELEGQNALRAKAYFAKIPSIPVVVPDVIWAKPRILVMENVSGHRVDDLEFMDSNGIDRDEVSAALARTFNTMIFGKDAPLHCDPHGGNIAIRKNTSRGRRGANFDVILYDHGLYRDIPIELRRSYAHFWLAIIEADEPKMRKYAFEVAGITDEQFPLFASAITGRDYKVVSTSVVTARTDAEKDNISSAMGDGLLQQLVELLGKVPRIILLILKTNDLTRSLDENLHTRQGPVRSFLILARYCSKTVFEEQLEAIKERGSLFRPSNLIRLAYAWWGFWRVELRLKVFETWLGAKRVAGLA